MVASFAFALAVLTSHPQDVLVAEQPTQAIRLTVGQVLVFSVFGNASTGASWTVKGTGTPGLKFLDISPVLDQSKPMMPGQGSYEHISFKAVKRGTYRVSMVYGRPRDLAKGAKPWDQRSAKVIVR